MLLFIKYRNKIANKESEIKLKKGKNNGKRKEGL
jgi:hypothetical protein